MYKYNNILLLELAIGNCKKVDSTTNGKRKGETSLLLILNPFLPQNSLQSLGHKMNNTFDFTHNKFYLRAFRMQIREGLEKVE